MLLEIRLGNRKCAFGGGFSRDLRGLFRLLVGRW